MEIRQLEVFCQVYELKSFSKAAEKLGLSQPTVSAHIQHLEDFLGKKLFDRSGRGIVPTSEAKLLYPYALEILKKRNEALSEISSIEKNPQGFLKIAASNIPGDYLIPKALSKIKKLLPSIILKVDILDSSKVIKLLRENIPDIDLGIVGAKPLDDKLEFKEIAKDEIVLIAPYSFKREEIKKEELEKIPIFLREEESGTRKTVEGKVKILNVAGILGSNTAIKEAVINGEGFAFVSKRSVEREVKGKLLKIVKVKGLNVKRSFYLVKRKDLSLQPAARVFWEEAKEIF